MSEDHDAGEALLRTGVAVPVRIMDEAVIPGADEAEFLPRLPLSFDDEDSPEEDRAEVVERGALGFLFANGCSPRPMPHSETRPACAPYARHCSS